MNLITPYYCIATSGETRDGRVIKPEWLLSMAKNYDPSESEAMLWRDHSRYQDPSGTVVSLKTEVDSKDRVRLFATIRPTVTLLAESKAAEIPFKFSIEVTKRGAENEYYLDGLAYTHDPASVAVDSLAFKQARPDVELITGEIKKLEFKRQSLFGHLFGSSVTVQPDDENFTQDIDEMTPEQFAVLQEVSAGLKTQATEIAAFRAEVKEVKDGFVKLEKNAGEADFKSLDKKLNGLEEKFAAQGETLAKTWECVEEIGTFSAGRFKRPKSTGREALSDLDY